MDLLNFSFWSNRSDVDRYAVTLDGTRYTGYWTLCACINRALRENIPITTPSTWISSTANREFFERVFRADSSCLESIPLLDERIDGMRQAGKVLCEKYDGSFANCVKEADGSAERLLEIITENFDSFKDERVYMDRTVKLHKRAQILVADLWACFEGKDYGRFEDIDMVTAFADYRVPQALVHFGALQYSSTLLKFLETGEKLPAGDRREIEIRGNTIWAVERIRQTILEQMGQEGRGESEIAPNGILLDFFIWDYSKAPENQESMKRIPIHHTRSVFY